MQKNIILSLIVPVFNTERFLKKCLDSVVRQTNTDGIEIIVIDDNSPDNSAQIISKYSSKYSFVKFYKNSTNLGLGATRNRGVSLAKGDYVSFLDSDDKIDTEYFASIKDVIVTKKVDFIKFKYRIFNYENKNIYTSGSFFKNKKLIPINFLFNETLKAKMSQMAADKIFKKSIIVENKIKFGNGYHEDLYFTFQFLYHAKSYECINKVLYYWFKRSNSISRTFSLKHARDIIDSLDFIKKFLKDKKLYTQYKSSFIYRKNHFILGFFEKYIIYNIRDEKLLMYIRNVFENYINVQEVECLRNVNDIIMYNKYYRFKNATFENAKIVFMKKQSIVNIVIILLYKFKTFLFDPFFPIGSGRREFIKKIIFKNFYSQKINNTSPKNKSFVNKILNYSDVVMPISSSERKKLLLLKNKFKGKRCFIVGNGPSLNKVDLNYLKNEFCFAVNGIFYKTDEMGFIPSFYMVEDGHVVDDNLSRINSYQTNFKFFPSIYRDKIKKAKNVYFFSADLGFYRSNHPSYCIPRFSKDFSKVAFAGQSVTYLNMQLAYFLGFTEVYLIGMDFNYVIRDSDKTVGASITTEDADVNHFHPEYFGYGKKWHDPKVERVALNYEMAKNIYDDDHRKIYNATIGGKLEIFDRVDYNSLFIK